MEISPIHMEAYANWRLKLHNYSGKPGGGDCATNHRSTASVMTVAIRGAGAMSNTEEIIKTVNNKT